MATRPLTGTPLPLNPRALPALLLGLLALVPATVQAGEVPPVPAMPGADLSASPPQPAGHLRIGLVLSGGGARGTAHVGVLKVLDALHVKVDAIAGTSMGAVVGGLYASGMSGEQVERLMRSVDWADAFRDRPPRADRSWRRKQEDRDYLVNLPLGFRGRQLLIPNGLIQGQKLTQILREATLPVAAIRDFDRLPIPFRAVATDLETGAAVILHDGDLTTAMRASMAAPGVISPVERDGRLLVDGGLVENLPIDIARAMGVDVLIVVDAGFPLQPRERLNSLTSVSNQALAILVQRDVRRQRATLGPSDVLIEPGLEGFASYDFRAVSRALQAGELAAQAQAPRLAALAATGAQYAAAVPAPAGSLPPSAPPAPAAPVMSFVRTEPGSTRYAGEVATLFGDFTGKPLDALAVQRRISELYGRGHLEALDFQVVPGPAGTQGLEFLARRKSWGPQYLRVGLSLQDDFAGNSQFNAGARLSFTELGRYDAESIWDMQIGASPRIATEYYQPLSLLHRWFVAPHVQADAHDVPEVVGTQPVRIYRVRNFEYGVDLGRELGNWGEVRAGVVDARGSQIVRVGAPVVTTDPWHTQAAFVRFGFDRLDSANFPRSGKAFSFTLRGEGRSAGADGADGADSLTFDWRTAWSRGKNTLVGWVSGGSTIGGTPRPRNEFLLGGFLNLSGVAAQSVAAPHYAIARAIYLRSVGTGGEGVLNVPAYAGFSFEMGNAWNQRSDVRLDTARRDYSLFFGADTFLGPAYLAAGYDDAGSTAFYLFLGRTF